MQHFSFATVSLVCHFSSHLYKCFVELKQSSFHSDTSFKNLGKFFQKLYAGLPLVKSTFLSLYSSPVGSRGRWSTMILEALARSPAVAVKMNYHQTVRLALETWSLTGRNNCYQGNMAFMFNTHLLIVGVSYWLRDRSSALVGLVKSSMKSASFSIGSCGLR